MDIVRNAIDVLVGDSDYESKSDAISVLWSVRLDSRHVHAIGRENLNELFFAGDWCSNSNLGEISIRMWGLFLNNSKDSVWKTLATKEFLTRVFYYVSEHGDCMGYKFAALVGKLTDAKFFNWDSVDPAAFSCLYTAYDRSVRQQAFRILNISGPTLWQGHDVERFLDNLVVWHGNKLAGFSDEISGYTSYVRQEAWEALANSPPEAWELIAPNRILDACSRREKVTDGSPLVYSSWKRAALDNAPEFWWASVELEGISALLEMRKSDGLFG